MNQIWQEFLAKRLKNSKIMLLLMGVFIEEADNYMAEIYRQPLDSTTEHSFQNSFSETLVTLLFSV